MKYENIGHLHSVDGSFFPFWPSNLIAKDIKKPTNSQNFVYELVG